MLKKLLKYDLVNIFKFLIIFYFLAIFFAVLTRIFLYNDTSFIIKVIGYICSGTTISMIFNILINNLMRLWVSFRQNIYGDESYLTHTLPLTKKTIYTSKILTAIISLFISVFVIGISLFVAYYTEEIVLIIKNMFNTEVFVFLVLIAFFLEMVNLLQIGFTGIILGHRKNNYKIGFSVLFGFIIYIGSQILVLLSVLLMALFNNEVMNLFVSNTVASLDLVKNLMYFTVIVYGTIIIVNYFVNVNLLKKGVNVD